ncbi:nurim homolog isoform X2 [Orussus abietinus]|uniref:nurim homolog isoform X2 n=1 Tax=Orussus abietinus TaxID=222816 RepID=UPI0006269A0B|nr:nurim homolog isoform X2 [Orussus abietinus]
MDGTILPHSYRPVCNKLRCSQVYSNTYVRMQIVKQFPKFVNLTVCAVSICYMGYVVTLFVNFLSSYNHGQKALAHSRSEEESLVLPTVTALLTDTCLLIIFILQHSVMASNLIKHLYWKINLFHLERGLYNASSAAVLHVLMNNWEYLQWITIWNVDVAYSNKLWLFFTALQFVGWFLVFCGCLVMDVSELVGLKQVMYKLSARPCPMSLKSREMQRFYSHMRHPSFTGFLIILWLHPLMTIDRLLLAGIFTVYMPLMWFIDEKDYQYYSIVAQKKRQEVF